MEAVHVLRDYPTHTLYLVQLSGSLHAALELTARFLSAHGQGLGQAGQPTIHTHKTLQMWSTRMALLTHLRLYKEAELELQAFGEMLNPDLYYQYHTNSYPGMKGKHCGFGTCPRVAVLIVGKKKIMVLLILAMLK